VRDGGQPLLVPTQQPGIRLGLGFTELGELFCNVCHRAVVLTDLHARGCWVGARRKPGVAQRISEGSHLLDIACASPVIAKALAKLTLESRGSRLGKCRHGGLSPEIAQEAQRVSGNGLVVGREL
jgi:hypothetical protein